MENMTVLELVQSIKDKKVTAEEVVKFYIDNCKKNEKYNAVVEVFDDALAQAKKVDEKIKNGEEVGKLAGVPVAIADNILVQGKVGSAASKFLEKFVSPYSATVVEKLVKEDAIILCRTNMDEFNVGSSNEYSLYGVCHNACDFDKVAGGAQGGAAVAVALDMAPVSIATDTGGTSRMPASLNGVVTIKPTFGVVSRYGIVGSSFDQVSPITKDVESNEYVLNVLAGKDFHDGMTLSVKLEDQKLNDKVTLGVIKEANVTKEFESQVEELKKQGFEIKEVSVPHFNKSLACYYVIAPAITTSNLAKFDGIKSSRRSEDITDLESVYVNSRSEGFGVEAKRRIILGNFVLSGENLQNYYNQARKVKNIITNEIENALKEVDAIVLPATKGPAFNIGEKVNDPVAMYKEDEYLVPASLSGLPAVTVPYTVDNNFVGMQFIGDRLTESKLYKIASKFENARRDK